MQAIVWKSHGARLVQLGDLESCFVWMHAAALIVDGGVPTMAAAWVW
jgi:hypothetical protein